MMQGFNGFPSGKVKSVKVPVPFFSELLPIIDHLAELKVTIYCIWALQQQESKYKYVRLADIAADEIFMAGLTSKISERAAILQEALERAVVRGTLFHVTVHLPGTQDEIYFMNTHDGRTALAALEKGAWVPGDEVRPVQMITERPTIFTLYEQNIGNITPLIGDQLKDAEQEYPEGWIAEAFQIAASHNKRSWSYVRAILDRWMREGKGKNGFSR